MAVKGKALDNQLRYSKRIRYALEFVPILLLEGFLRVLGYPRALRFGAALGRGLGRILSSRQKVARENILHALGPIQAQRVQEIIQGCWQSLGLTAVELVYRFKIGKEDYFKQVQVENFEELQAAQKLGKGVLILTGHFGAWEFGAPTFPFLNSPTSFVARRIKNPHVNAWVNRRRCAFGNKVILARDAVRQSIQHLKQGRNVILLIDHRVTQGGLKLPFLGRQAYTSSLPAVLALRYKVPVFSMQILRLPPGSLHRVKITFEKVDGLADLKPNEEGIFKASLIFNSIFEAWVRRYPQQWLWIHNRWKQ